MGRYIAIGDVHGCVDELLDLFYALKYRDDDHLIFVGDLLDRGPDSASVVRIVRRKVQENNAVCVMGNHDEWYVRRAKHALSGKPNPMKPNPDKERIFQTLGIEDLAFLSSLPLYHRIDSKTVVVHAGMRPGVPIEKQLPNELLRMRYLERATGKMISLDSDKLLTPDVAAFWTEVWTGPDEVIYGHHPSKTDTIVTENNGVHCWGIDTGCCFGNKLTAWVRDESGKVSLVSVPARQQYSKWRDGE